MIKKTNVTAHSFEDEYGFTDFIRIEKEKEVEEIEELKGIFLQEAPTQEEKDLKEQEVFEYIRKTIPIKKGYKDYLAFRQDGKRLGNGMDLHPQAVREEISQKMGFRSYYELVKTGFRLGEKIDFSENTLKKW